MSVWLHVIGIGDNGLDSLSPATRSILESAEVIFGADRHHDLTAHLTAERRAWPSPFDALISDLKSLKGKRVVVLATGDPLWYSVGARIARDIDPSEILFHPQLSAFQLAAARMGWSLADCETLTIHGRPTEQIIPFLAPYQSLLILTKDATSPAQVARILRERGYGASRLTALAHMNGANETRLDGTAADWSHDVPDFHTLAVACIADNGVAVLPRTGLPDSAFASDGTMTKQEVRAVTLAKLAPARGALLWDIGCGSGSVAIEWMRAARDARAIGIETRADRRAFAAENAVTLGAPALNLIDGTAPEALANLPAPDAVFIGGGLTPEVFAVAWSTLKPHGRLVANTVTLEGEAVLLALRAQFGGTLSRIAVERAVPVGRLTGWKPSMTVTQWSLSK
ncbi:bifunctional cobalt-precorrin-7 (C(5))-methyltransferase/cobalt-precorrin-6B (C(15))-methyltransferase [Celeribacter marinus]|uniref:Cobalt-precorrin-6y C5-methyltransferase n=1 Tax=Celeribacter marinus TaxID=1397108 RepID=A0A0N9ZYY5_9RHOB|nr:bifunctional cobalt-precorrin-7 (C(5))-methyltransferase/cobalt-precorrin-6B (C(15))-methyltransferase [Celeribacter marinus]ALI55495.1 Cobalt-precorrin-6y C5-methyltransferase [Celeribacter marinus]SFK20729.1 precorrin-6Y C5,15-methyltransferase (decarboxylating) [Celeribacter marinus]